MIRFISRAVAEWLLKHGAISVNEKELYEYSIYSFLFTLTPLFLVLMVSIPLNMAVEGILLITPFIFLRKFAGGFHFQNPLPCIIVSTLVLLGVPSRKQNNPRVWKFHYPHSSCLCFNCSNLYFKPDRLRKSSTFCERKICLSPNCHCACNHQCRTIFSAAYSPHC